MKHYPLSGCREYCLEANCDNDVHHEDAPDFYPFCPKHKQMNTSYYQQKKEHQQFMDMYNELTS